MDKQLLFNAVGTMFNVAQEMEHPDKQQLLDLLNEVADDMSRIEGRRLLSFDLRHRRFDGSKFDGS